jgi:hypothetical protein
MTAVLRIEIVAKRGSIQAENRLEVWNPKVHNHLVKKKMPLM